MLRKLWRWLIGEPVPARTDALLEILIESQQRTTTAVMNAVAQIGQASEKQAEVLNSYLRLFQTNETPERWVQDEVAENEEELMKEGFPVQGTEQEQARWVLDHLPSL